jgi:hypothetical protein
MTDEAARSIRYCGREIEDEDGIELPAEAPAKEMRVERNKRT